MRRYSRTYTSLNRNQTIMGVEKRAFMVEAFYASAMFANGFYAGLLMLPLIHALMRWLTKKDYMFFEIFMRYMNEGDAYSSIPQPSDWERRPLGWGRGLPW
jgi:type IV secretory pathway TrbD component